MEDSDTLYARWLSGDISPEELQQLKADGTLESLETIIRTSESLSLPKYDTTAGYDKFKANHISPKVAKEIPLRAKSWRWIVGIAASIAVLIGVNIAFDSEKLYLVENGTTKVVQPGDGSKITINDGSSVRYTYDDWDIERTIHLDGEALFDVEKGKPFIVKTDQGEIRVLGTQFNVSAWGSNLQVTCYEGKVQVISSGHEIILIQGERIEVIDQVMSEKQAVLAKEPSWIQGVSTFTNVPVKDVFAELERQYNIKVSLTNVNRRFTGSFSHDNLETAVSDICKPLGLQFSLSEDGSSVQIEPQ